MSTLKVEVCKIEDVRPHPNADKLDIGTVKGWQCVLPKGKYSAGDAAVYFPIDSILSEDLQAKVFGPDSKIKLNKGRIRTINLRGVYSQGLVVSLDTLGLNEKVGTDLTDVLGVTKYEPPPPRTKIFGNSATAVRVENPDFKKYTNLEHLKNHPHMFEYEDKVVILEKIHGTNFRAGWVKYNADTWYKKILKFFKVAPKYQFMVGSHNVQYSPDSKDSNSNVYLKTALQYDLKNKLGPGEVVYGEVYGPPIQKGYHYGLGPGETQLVVFDIKVDGMYLAHAGFVDKASSLALPTPPVLYLGPFGEANIDELVLGDSELHADQKIREGVVIKSFCEKHDVNLGRAILKAVSPEYLMKDNTEFH